MTGMQRKLKVMIARWLAHRIERRAHRLRRALRDFDRAQWLEIHAAERRARGLRLYAAWSFKEKEQNYGTIVPLQSAAAVDKQAKGRAA